MLGKRKSKTKDVSSDHSKKVVRTQKTALSGKAQKRERPESRSSPDIGAAPTGSLTLKQVRVALKALLAQLEAIEKEYMLLERIWYKNAAQFKSALWWKAFDGARRPIKRTFASNAAPSRQQREEEKQVSESEARRTARICVEVYAAMWAPPAPALSTNTAQPLIGSWPTVPKFAPSPSRVPGATAEQALRELADLQRMLEQIRLRALRAGEVLTLHLNTPPAPTFAPLVTTLLALLASVHAAITVILDPPQVEQGLTQTRGSPISQLRLAFTHGPGSAPSFPRNVVS